jgi:hypothetical protein
VGGDGRVRSRRLVGLVLVVCAVLCAHTTVGLLVPGTALASRAHAFSFAFGRTGAVQGEAESLALTPSPAREKEAGSGVAVDAATHDVYVADPGNRRIDEFTADGAFIRAWGWGVATGAASLEVCTSSCRPALSGSGPGEFEVPSFVVVDNSSGPSKGDVYVGDTADQLVTKFDAEGGLVSGWGNNGENAKKERTEPNGQLNGSPTETFNGSAFLETIAGIAVDGSGHLWVHDTRQIMFEFNQEGHWLATCNPGAAGVQPHGIAVDDACTEHCGLDIMGPAAQVIRMTEACQPEPPKTEEGWKGSFLVGQAGANPERVSGLAVDSATGDLFDDRSGTKVEDIPADCRPSGSGCEPSQIFGEELASGGVGPPPPLAGATGVAVDPGSGIVYVANAATNQVVAFAVSIGANALAATGVTAHTAVLRGAVEPDGAELSRCRFEYGKLEPGKTTVYAASVPCQPSLSVIGHGSEPVPVSAEIKGLAGGTAYQYRLNAKNANGTIQSAGETLLTTTTAVVTEIAATGVTAGSAVLTAKINPEGMAARYHFEYGICKPATSCYSSAFEASEPETDVEIPAGSTAVPVSQQIEGLLAGNTYHVRITVTDANNEATEPKPETTFEVAPKPPSCATPRPGPDEQLADCRQYEQVSPTAKDGALIDNGAFLIPPSIARDGSRVISKSIQCFHQPESCIGIRQTEGEPYAFERTESGWQTTPLTPPASIGGTSLGYSADTGLVLYALAATPPALEQFYSRTPGGVFHAIGPVAEGTGTRLGPVADRPMVTTADLSRVVYGSGREPWPSLEAGTFNEAENVLEYKGTGNSVPELVGVTGPAASTSLIGACGTVLGSNDNFGTLSADGRSVVFTVQACPHGTGENASTPVPAAEVYSRIEQAKGMSTVLISAPGGASECDANCKAQPASGALYRGASSDGSRVYFTSTQQLTNQASEDKHAGDEATGEGCTHTLSVATGCNLYEFECPNHCEDASERHLIDVSAGDTSGLGPQVQGVFAMPPDGSHVYFVARGVLSGANATGQEPVPGGLNLYVYWAGSGGGVRGQAHFIATLSPSDAAQWTHIKTDDGVANVTPDGRYLVFTSHQALTPDATPTEEPGQEPPAQVYRYDAESEALARVSIGSNGFGDNGNAALHDAGIMHMINGLEDGIGGPERTDPTMSDDGRFVFFESPTALAPGALDNHPVTGNPKAMAENVYEWEANGSQPSANAPACEQPAGCVSLISDGKDIAEGSGAHYSFSAVQLLGTDSTGENVFFWTADQLVSRDTDTQVDLYDARVDGGFAEPAEPEPCASLDRCRPQTPASSLFGAPSSEVFSGLGNVAAGTGQQSLTRRLRARSGSPAQRFARALQACRRRSSSVARRRCEDNARRVYDAQLLAAALRACRKKHGAARKACERRAHARFQSRGRRG